MKMMSGNAAPGSQVTESAQVAEADGNRTRRRRDAPSTGFEDRGGHQAPGRLRGRPYPRAAAATVIGPGARRGPVGHEARSVALHWRM